MEETILLPLPRLRGEISVEEALASRRSVREFSPDPLTVEELSQILWAAYGVSETKWGLRTAPSAGARYPLVVYAVVGRGGVSRGGGESLEPGSYRYDPHAHALKLIKRGDLRADLRRASLDQEWVEEAPVSLAISAIYERTTARYGSRGASRYVPMDLGHLGQNVYLQAVALGLGTVAIGAFRDEEVKRVVGMGPEEVPLYVMPVGRPLRRHVLTPEDLERYYARRRP
ncbi:MAG: SagB/ThcOx family dehydrogenase [Fervidicoccaceae archaeon]